jgi:hypothetical protein
MRVKNSKAGSPSQTGAQNLKFERADWTSFRTVEGLQQKAGVPQDKLIRLRPTSLQLAKGRLDGMDPSPGVVSAPIRLGPATGMAANRRPARVVEEILPQRLSRPHHASQHGGLSLSEA